MSLTTKMVTNNFSKGRWINSTTKSDIKEITIHHAAGAILLPNLYTRGCDMSVGTTSHYGIRDDDCWQFVDEADTAWTNGNWLANCRAVTIEVSNSTGAPQWEISDKSLLTLVRLVYDIAQRNDLLPLVKGVSLTWHSMYIATGCPGPYLMSKLDDIVNKVNALYTTVGGDYDDNGFYRVRSNWSDPSTQKGAFKNLDNAIKFAKDLNSRETYFVFNEFGDVISEFGDVTDQN